ncbi:hypothetical protein JXB27_01060 [Candidatus Woesearchaeota archaeon]|nr:hypothetical protein [Candidatus Woesearchaeota archaeon]
MNLRETIVELEKVNRHIENNDFSKLHLSGAEILAKEGLLQIVEYKEAPVFLDKDEQYYQGLLEDAKDLSKKRELLEQKPPLLKRLFQKKAEKESRKKELVEVLKEQYELQNEIIFMKNHALMTDERYVALTHFGRRIHLNFAVKDIGEYGLHLEHPTSDVDIGLLVSKWKDLDYGITPIHHAAKTLNVPIDEMLLDTQIRLCDLIRSEKRKFEENYKGNELNTELNYKHHFDDKNGREIYEKMPAGIIAALVEAYKTNKSHGNFGLILSDKETRLQNPVAMWSKKTGEWDVNGGNQYDSPEMHVSYEDAPLFAEIVPCEKDAGVVVQEVSR